MSDSEISQVTGSRWWGPLGLNHVRTHADARGIGLVLQAKLNFLETHPPVAFAAGESGETIDLNQIVEQLTKVINEAQSELDRFHAAELAKRDADFSAQFVEALERATAESPIDEGIWAGFTPGEAIAWSWNCLEFEPLALKWAYKPAEVEILLRKGELPEILEYSDLAKRYVSSGIDARSYRNFAVARKAFDRMFRALS